MLNYSDKRRAHHVEDEAQVMRALFCPFMRRCCKVQLANNHRNKSLWHPGGYFCMKEVVSLKQWLLIYTQLAERANFQGSRHFQKNDANVPKHKEVSVYRILIFVALYCCPA